MTAPASLLADLRQLERLAVAAGCDDAWLGGAIARLTLLCVGVPIARVDGFLRAQQLVEHGLAVKIACSRAGLSRDAYYRLLQILQHHQCDPPRQRFELGGKTIMRVIKTTKLPDADKVAVPQAGNGKPQWTAPATPRADGGMSTGATGGNFDAGTTPPNATPADLLDKPGTGNP